MQSKDVLALMDLSLWATTMRLLNMSVSHALYCVLHDNLYPPTAH